MVLAMRGYLGIALLLIGGICQAQDIYLNEIMSANVSIITDEDGDFPDWIELFNADTNRQFQRFIKN